MKKVLIFSFVILLVMACCKPPKEDIKPPRDYRDQWIGNYNFSVSYLDILLNYPNHRMDTFREFSNSIGSIEKHETNSIKIISSSEPLSGSLTIYATVDSAGTLDNINSGISSRVRRGNFINNDSIVLFIYQYFASGSSYRYDISGIKIK
jgi:hypothetical protein